MTSNVGSAGVYEAGDQRNYANDDPKLQEERYNEGKTKKGAHSQQDPKDERSIANKLAAETSAGQSTENKNKSKSTFEQNLGKEDPTAPARMHGNEPSKGAKIDAELQAEEEEILKAKGEFGPTKSN